MKGLRLDSELDLKRILSENPNLKVRDDYRAPAARYRITLPRIVSVSEMRQESEDTVQARFFDFIDANVELVPVLDMMYAVPNGTHKSKAARAKFQRTGLKSGVPDTHLPVASGGYHSLYIEFKTWKTRTNISDTQEWWIDNLRRQGHKVLVLYSAYSAALAVLDYLQIDYRNTASLQK